MHQRAWFVGIWVLLSFSALVRGDAPCALANLWPQPTTCDCSNTTTLTLDPSSLRFNISPATANTATLQAAIARWRNNTFTTPIVTSRRGLIEPHLNSTAPGPDASASARRSSNAVEALTAIGILITGSEVDGYKSLESDEGYALHVEAPTAVISATSVWGALYGLETLGQLVTFDASLSSFVIAAAPYIITDDPRFPWRGLQLDTANHFLSPTTIKRTIDGLAANKMNLLHWHLVDSYSFPLQSPAYPLLARYGAWQWPNASYSPADVADIVEHARLRGVRVVPELDVPGHGYAWGLGYPNLTVACPASLSTSIGQINNVPLDPTNEFTYTVVETLLGELAHAFPDGSLHVGGDELQFECWAASPAVQAWMRAHNVTGGVLELLRGFERRLIGMLGALGKRPVVWQDSFADIADVLAPARPIFEMWNNDSVTEQALAAGFDVIVADSWYLDRQNPVSGLSTWFQGDIWAQMYMVEPTDLHNKPGLRSSGARSRQQQPSQPGVTRGNILGGEANMWTEQVTETNIDSQLWPRTAAIAERLWSPLTLTNQGPGQAAQRLAAHRCRMAQRGLRSGPIWSDFCSADAQFASPSSPGGGYCPPSGDNGSGVRLSPGLLSLVVLGSAFGGALLLALGLLAAGHWRTDRAERSSLLGGSASAAGSSATEESGLHRSQQHTYNT